MSETVSWHLSSSDDDARGRAMVVAVAIKDGVAGYGGFKVGFVASMVEGLQTPFCFEGEMADNGADMLNTVSEGS